MRISMLSKKTLAKLYQFVIEKDRTYPRTFVGRKDVVNAIRDKSELVYKEYQNQSSQFATTQFVLGPQGAGKSSLLLHLQKAAAWKDFKNISGTSRPDPLVFYLAGPYGFMDLRSFGRALRTFLKECQRDSLSTSSKTITEGSAEIGSFVNGSHADDSFGKYKDPIEIITRDSSINWNRPLIIAIDEFHNIDGYWNKKWNRGSELHVGILRKLHNGSYRKPILLVLGGLCTVPNKLLDCNIRRLPDENNHSIGSFKRSEMNELIEAWREKLEIQKGPWQEEILQMAEEYLHWPTHIHNSLLALGQEILDSKGEMSNLDMQRMRVNETRRRESYYRVRINPQLRESEHLLKEVMKKMPTQGEQGSNIKFYNIVDSIEEATSNSPSWQLPKGIENARDYVELMIHQGLIQKQKDHCYYCPIPSLKSYILKPSLQSIIRFRN